MKAGLLDSGLLSIATPVVRPVVVRRVIYPALDTYTIQNTPDTAGASNMVSTNFTAGSRRRAFVRFDLSALSGLPPIRA